MTEPKDLLPFDAAEYDHRLEAARAAMAGAPPAAGCGAAGVLLLSQSPPQVTRRFTHTPGRPPPTPRN